MTISYTQDALESFSRANSPDERKAALRKTPALAQPTTVRALYDRVAHYLRVNLSKAHETAQSSLWLANHIEHPPSIALSLRALGNVLLLSNHPHEALENYSAALDLFLQMEDNEQAAQTHLNVLSAHIRTGDYVAAHDTASAARQLFTQLDDELGLARLDNNLASLLFRQEDFLEARKHWKSALSTFQTLGQSHDAAIALRNLAVCEISLDNFHEALDIYKQVTAYCTQHNLTLLLHEIDYNIAYLFFLRGNHDRALEGYRLARARSLELGDAYHAALCDLDESELYLELNLLPDAIALARSANSAFEKLRKSYEAAKALAFEAIATARQGDDHRALELLRVARAAFSGPGHLGWESLALLYEALVLSREGRRFEAQRACNQAESGFDRLHNPAKSALCRVLLGRLALDSNDTAAAEVSAQRALASLSAHDLPQVLFEVHLLLGDIADQLEDPSSALEHFYKAERLLEDLRTMQSSADLHIPFPHGRLAVYDRLLRLEHLRHTPNALTPIAFRLIEKAKARTLSDLLGPRAAAIPPTSPTRSGLVEKIRGLREELRWYYKTLSQRELRPSPKNRDTADPGALQKMERQIVASLTEIASVDRQFGHLHEVFSISLVQIQELLADDEAILEYFVGDDVITLIFISATTCSTQPVAITQDVQELRRQLEFLLARTVNESERSTTRQQSLRLERRCLQKLHLELIQPVSSRFDGLKAFRVVPHGFLSYLPFHAFFTLEPCGDDAPVVSYAPDVTSLYFCKRRNHAAKPKTALVMDSPAKPSGADRWLLAPPWSARTMPEGAPQEDWREMLSRGWDVISLPLIVNFRLDNPVLSEVRISGSSLNVLDLFQLELNANLVVLTDCGCVSPRTGTGDEILFLSRGALYSGPRALLMPLWRGRAASSQVFLESFYASLSSGSAVSCAALFAQRECRREFPSLADWAPFAMFGL